MNRCIICSSDSGFDLICRECKDAVISMKDYNILSRQISLKKEKNAPHKKEILKKLNALNDAMHRHQCYTCSHDFVELAKDFGTNIVGETIEFIESIPDEEE